MICKHGVIRQPCPECRIEIAEASAFDRGRLACAYEIASALTHAGYPQTGNPVDLVRAVIERLENEK